MSLGWLRETPEQHLASMPQLQLLGRPFSKEGTKMACSLGHVATVDLMCELARRTIAGDKAADAPQSLLKLALLMAFVLGPKTSILFAEELRNSADELEHVHLVQ